MKVIPRFLTVAIGTMPLLLLLIIENVWLLRSSLLGVPLSSPLTTAITRANMVGNVLHTSNKFPRKIYELNRPPIESSLQRHGTTTIAFLTESGIIVAVDSR